MDSDITLDELRRFDLTVAQPRHGYRYSLDPLLLAKFCGPVPTGGSIADLGAGCGIIGLVLARLHPTALLTAVENNPDMASLIRQNVIRNGLSERCLVSTEDVVAVRGRFADSTFDLVVSNPPFRRAGSGKISPRAGRDSARHETTAGLADFLAAAKYLVQPSGRICFIQLPSRLPEFMALAVEMKLSVLRLRMIHNNGRSPATMFMAELAKGRRTTPVMEMPLFVRDQTGEYTDEVWR